MHGMSKKINNRVRKESANQRKERKEKKAQVKNKWRTGLEVR